jgi:uncharacterized protein YecT (DUF1311 family)
VNTLSIGLARLACVAALLAACAGGPPPPDWQLNAQSSIERAVAAHLTGDTRIEVLEFDRARGEVARTGQGALVARVELMRCAARVASLEFEPCSGFELLRADAAEPERAYADYLAARTTTPAQAALLPAAQRAAATAQGDSAAAALRAIDEPLSRLVAAGVMFQSGRASPEVMALATETASAQGWRRPLLAWLKLQHARAQSAGWTDQALRLQRRIELVQGGGAAEPGR